MREQNRNKVVTSKLVQEDFVHSTFLKENSALQGQHIHLTQTSCHVKNVKGYLEIILDRS